MCDAYAQSTQHARAVAWLESGPLPAWLSDDTNAGGSDRPSDAKQGPGRLARLQAGARSLLQAAVTAVGAVAFSAGQSPAGR
jgi:hypothetical protein